MVPLVSLLHINQIAINKLLWKTWYLSTGIVHYVARFDKRFCSIIQRSLFLETILLVSSINHVGNTDFNSDQFIRQSLREEEEGGWCCVLSHHEHKITAYTIL